MENENYEGKRKKDEKERRTRKKSRAGKSRWKFRMITKIELFVPPKVIARKTGGEDQRRGKYNSCEQQKIIRLDACVKRGAHIGEMLLANGLLSPSLAFALAFWFGRLVATAVYIIMRNISLLSLSLALRYSTHSHILRHLNTMVIALKQQQVCVCVGVCLCVHTTTQKHSVFKREEKKKNQITKIAFNNG